MKKGLNREQHVKIENLKIKQFENVSWEHDNFIKLKCSNINSNNLK
jgi:hypothetical protein